MTLSRTIAKTVIEKNIDVDTIIRVLQEYKLLQLLPAIKKELLHYVSRERTKGLLLIETPFPLSESSIEHIHTITGSKGSQYEIRILKDLLAGFRARHKGKLYDASARRIIKELTS